MTLLWWAIVFGMYLAIEAGCVWLVLRGGQMWLALLAGGVLALFVAPLFAILLAVLMTQLDSGLHGGAGTGIGYAMPMVAIASLPVHVVVIGLAKAYVASLRAEARQSTPETPDA